MGRTSIKEPGKKALNPCTSTVNPPLTLPLIIPITASSAFKAASNIIHDSAARAFSLDNLVAPKPSSTASRDTCTSSPIFIEISPLSSRNFF
jgi:hypothetical protein